MTFYLQVFSAEFLLERVNELPELVHMDVKEVIEKLDGELFDANLLRSYGLSNMDLVERLREMYT